MPALPLLATLLAALAGSGACWAQSVYRCRDAQGHTSFSDTPCGANAERIELRQPTVIQSLPRALIDAPVAKPAARLRAKADGCPGAQAVQQAIFRKQVLLCMSMAEVDRAADPSLRENFRTSTGADEAGPYVERLYGSSSEAWPRYVKFRDGRVAEYRQDPPQPACYPHCGLRAYPGQPAPGYAPRLPAYPAYPYAQPETQPAPAVDIQIRLGDKPESQPINPDKKEEP